MPMLAQLFGQRRRKNREEVAGRALEVIVQVLRDIGIDRFLNGSLLLDARFRVRFVSVPPASARDLLALVPVRELPEALILRAYVHDAGLDAAELTRHGRLLADGLMRELLARAPALAALPERRAESGVAGQPD